MLVVLEVECWHVEIKLANQAVFEESFLQHFYDNDFGLDLVAGEVARLEEEMLAQIFLNLRIILAIPHRCGVLCLAAAVDLHDGVEWAGAILGVFRLQVLNALDKDVDHEVARRHDADFEFVQ